MGMFGKLMLLCCSLAGSWGPVRRGGCVVVLIVSLGLMFGWLDSCRGDTPGGGSADVPSFVNDILPLLTRFDCNSGGCHGKLAGQNGFRLSLRGFAPEADFESLTRESRGRQIGRAHV